MYTVYPLAYVHSKAYKLYHKKIIIIINTYNMVAFKVTQNLYKLHHIALRE